MASGEQPARPAATDYDVLVLGGGPAGATAAALLATAGVRVLVLEKAEFPRFHIGESLLPKSIPSLARLGIDLDASRQVKKAGAEFVDELGQESAYFPFADALPGSTPYAYQVERAEFDTLLLARAEQLGAVVRQRCAAEAVQHGPNSVSVRANGTYYRARYLIDASGQHAFLARRKRAVAPLKNFGRAASFAHFGNLTADAVRALGIEGNIKVLMLQRGWAWVIPLPRERVSIGLVKATGQVRAEDLQAQIASSPLLQRITKGSTAEEARLVGNYSYLNKESSGARYACIGDAACFIDPVFSSGVALAIESAERLCSLLLPALNEGREDDVELMRPLASHMAIAHRSIGALVHSFYHTELVRNLFFAENPDSEVRAGLISVLAGDIWRKDNRFQAMLARSSRRSLSVFDEPASAATR